MVLHELTFACLQIFSTNIQNLHIQSLKLECSQALRFFISSTSFLLQSLDSLEIGAPRCWSRCFKETLYISYLVRISMATDIPT